MLMMREREAMRRGRPEAEVTLRTSCSREASAMPLLVAAIQAAGAWVDVRRPGHVVEMHVEVPLRSVVEFYGALIGWGLELARESHAAMSGLCMQRLQQRHGFHPLRLRHPVRITLTVRFAEETGGDVEGVGLA